MKQRYSIYEQIEPKTALPFRLIETNMTCDGPRSRLTNFCFASLVSARAELEVLQTIETRDRATSFTKE